MTHPVSAVYVDGAGNAPSKSAIRALWRDRVPTYVASVAELQAMTTAAANAFALDGVIWLVDLADTTSPHDGVTVIVSADGYRYKPRRQVNIEGRNLLINPRFLVNQRGFAGGALAQNTFGWDRWKAGSGGAVVSVSNDVITHTSGRLGQVVEGLMWDNWALSQMVFSVTDLSTDLFVVITHGAATYSATLTAGSGRRYMAFSTVNSNANMTVELRANAGAATYKWPCVEFGTVPSAWRARPLQEEQLLCERYLQIYGGQGGATGQVLAPVVCLTSALAQAVMVFRSRMRGPPSVTFGGTIGSDFRLQSTNGGVPSNFILLSSITPLAIASTGCAFNLVPATATLTNGFAGAFALNGAAARVIFDAEI